MVRLLCVKGNAGEEAERLAEVLELEGADQRLAAIFQHPAFRCVHRDSPVLQPRYRLMALLSAQLPAKVTKWRKWKKPRFFYFATRQRLEISSFQAQLAPRRR